MSHVELTHNGEVLEGFRNGESDRLALHVHGSWGNYNGNPFVEHVSDTYVANGWSYASTNNPGHDEGTINEDFSESFDVISQWIDQLVPQGTQIILQGHSLGALKILAMSQEDRHIELIKRVAGIVLLSPFDLVAFYGGENIERRRNHAKEFRDEQGERAILPDSIFDVWEISAGTYLELSEQGGAYDVFPTRERSIGLLGRLKIPTLVVIGGDDIASYPSPSAVHELLEESKCNAAFIENAPHNFAGYEDQLAAIINDFVQSLS